MKTDHMSWHAAARRYLERLGVAEYAQQKTSARGRKRWAYIPTPYHRELIDCLNHNDEHAFKQLKALQGDASAVGA